MPSWRGRARCTAPRRAWAARSDVRIEVAYALAQGAIQRTYDLPEGATVGDALRAASEDPAFAAIDVEGSPIGVFGVLARREQPLHPGDRVEIYRPLALDPKAARRARVKQARALKGAPKGGK
jgi:putative ubiquitin-RnfH superfamily antitoxin RatB of RatAB toxin-antitoxin module